eukprot:CAMPEP_0177599586 /NCGR_PEP_ID=MMETSP0419_2-20121207/13083_1 /TAXON_ID=582737 /ORGANISM="Tetraselmis sp., Strain GSL018" /LENGTH=489 /DNA_ID=CAMNT_0019092351 /DNA_START=220 /DNA_END=1690 /DNA_ORIENTATION=+
MFEKVAVDLSAKSELLSLNASACQAGRTTASRTAILFATTGRYTGSTAGSEYSPPVQNEDGGVAASTNASGRLSTLKYVPGAGHPREMASQVHEPGDVESNLAEDVSPPSRKHSKRRAVPLPLPRRELDRAARLASVNSYVYTVSDEQLEGKLQAAGLALLAQGRNRYTRWFVAEGRLPQVHARPSGAARRRAAPSGAAVTPMANTHPGASQELELWEEQDYHWGVERLVFVRGVVWRDPTIDLRSLWQELANCWPVPFEPSFLDSQDVMVHRGVEGIASEVWDSLLPWILDVPEGRTLNFVGHSLGGALALVLAAKARAKLRLRGSDLKCYTFGSPSVMAHRRGEPGEAVCRLLGMDPASIQSFCLDDDPVPRAMLSVDPAYSLLRRSELGERILKWRESWLGSGPLTLNRFLFEPVGRHFLIRWDPSTGSRLVEVGEGDNAVRLDEAMKMHVEQMLAEPMRLIKAMTDHNQGAYVSELLLASKEHVD